MPFKRNSPELGAVAGKVILEFVRNEHPEKFQGFLDGTGRTEEEWKKTVTITHNEFLKLQELLYQTWGKVDPWKFVDIGKYLTHTDNIAVSAARLAGSAAAVVALSDTESNPKLNIDSRLEVLALTTEREGKKTIGQATIVHTNLGFVGLKYLTAPTTSAGYLRGIPTLWNFEPMNVEIKMIDQSLEDILKREFQSVTTNLTKDQEGNYISDGRVVAKAVMFSETPYGVIKIKKHKGEREKPKVYKITQGESTGELFVGNPGVILGLSLDSFEEVDLDSLDMHYTEKDLFGTDSNGNQILIAKGGTYFGGPLSVYELQWEERPLNWIKRWFIRNRERAKSESSRDIMHEIARREALQRAEKEKELAEAQRQSDILRMQMTSLTRDRMTALDEKEQLKGNAYKWLHDTKHEFADTYSKAISFIIDVLEMAEVFLPKEIRNNIYSESLRNEKIKCAKEIRLYFNPKTTEELADSSEQRIVLDTLDLLDVYEQLKIYAKKGSEDPQERRFFSWLTETFDQNLEELMSIGEKGSQNIQERLDSVKGIIQVKVVDYSKLLEDTVNKYIAINYPDVKIEMDFPKGLSIKGDADDLRVIAFNTLDNSCEAARNSSQDKKYVKIAFREEDKFVEIITENSGNISDQVLEKLNLAGREERFSTKRGDQGGYGTMAMSRILGTYGGNSNYSRGEGTVIHIARIPKHRIIN